jgi:hypothetical protein
MEKNVYVNWPKDYIGSDYNATNSSVMVGYVSVHSFPIIPEKNSGQSIFFPKISAGQKEKLPIRIFSKKPLSNGGSMKSHDTEKTFYFTVYG